MPNYIELIPMDAGDVPNATEGRYNYFIDAADETPKLKNSDGEIKSAGGGSEIGLVPYFGFDYSKATPIDFKNNWIGENDFDQPWLILALIFKMGTDKIKHFSFTRDTVTSEGTGYSIDELGYNISELNDNGNFGRGFSLMKNRTFETEEGSGLFFDEYFLIIYLHTERQYGDNYSTDISNQRWKLFVPQTNFEYSLPDINSSYFWDIDGTEKFINYFNYGDTNNYAI